MIVGETGKFYETGFLIGVPLGGADMNNYGATT